MDTDAALKSLGRLMNPELEEIGLLPFALVLTLSLVCGLFIALLYRRFYARRETGSQIQRAFPLLSVAITAIFICIQFSLPLSLGLLGALSIVRFRTPIKEPEEIGFLMVVIATSLSCATFNFKFLGVIIGVSLIGLLIQEFAPRALRGTPGSGVLLLSLPQSQFSSLRKKLLSILSAASPRGSVESISSHGDEVVVTFGFRGLSAEGAGDLQERLLEEVKPGQISLSFERGSGG